MRIRPLHFVSAIIVVLAIITACPSAQAQKEFPPPQGKGRVVVVVSGAGGVDHYEKVSQAIAALGYDAVLFDGATMEGTHGEALKSAIPQALAMPHALPGKVALVGFSVGGGIALAYGAQWPDQVAVVILWYPVTSVIRDPLGFASRLKVPVLMFAGESDNGPSLRLRECCKVSTAHSLADAAKAANQPFDLFTYPGAEHDFVRGEKHYNPAADMDAFEKTTAKLKESLGS